MPRTFFSDDPYLQSTHSGENVGPDLMLIGQEFSSSCFWEQKPWTISWKRPTSGRGSCRDSGGAVFSPSSYLTNGIKQSSETWQFPPNRLILTFCLISFMLLKTLEAKGSHTYKAVEGPFSTFHATPGSSVSCYREHLLSILSWAVQPTGPAGPLSQPSRFRVVWWRLWLSLQTVFYFSPAPSVYCVDGGGDWINKAVKSQKEHMEKETEPPTAASFALYSGAKCELHLDGTWWL